MSAEIRTGEAQRERKKQEPGQPDEKGFLFSSDNVSLFFKGGGEEKPLDLWNV